MFGGHSRETTRVPFLSCREHAALKRKIHHLPRIKVTRVLADGSLKTAQKSSAKYTVHGDDQELAGGARKRLRDINTKKRSTTFQAKSRVSNILFLIQLGDVMLCHSSRFNTIYGPMRLKKDKHRPSVKL